MSSLGGYIHQGGELGPLGELFLCTSLGAQTRLVSYRNAFVEGIEQTHPFFGKVICQIPKMAFSLGFLAVGLMSLVEGVVRIAFALLILPIFCISPNINRLPQPFHNIVKLGFVSALTGILAFPTAKVALGIAWENLYSFEPIDVDAHYNACVCP